MSPCLVSELPCMDAFDGLLLSLPVPPIREADLHPLARVTCQFARWLLVEAIPEEQREVSAIKKHVPGPAAEGFHRWQFHSALEYLSESDVSYWSSLSAPGSQVGQVW